MAVILALMFGQLGAVSGQDEAQSPESVVRGRYASASDALSSGDTAAFLDMYAEDFLGPMGATLSARRDEARGLVRDSMDRSVVYTLDGIHASEQSAIVAVTEVLQAFDRETAITLERRRHVLHRWQSVDGSWKLVRETELDPLSAPLEPGDTFTDPVYGLAATVPDGFFGYVCAIRAGRQVTMVSSDLNVDLDVMGHKLNDRLNPQFLALVGARAMGDMVPDYMLEGLAEATLGGAAGVKSVSTYTRGGAPVRGEVTIVTHGRQLFSVGVTSAPPKAMDAHGAVIDALLRGFTVVETTERPQPSRRGELDGASYHNPRLGVRFEVPPNWTASVGDMWDAQLTCKSPDGQGRITLGCIRLPSALSSDEDPRYAAEDLLMGFDEAAMGRADACKQLSIADIDILGVVGVQSTTELTFGESTRKRILTVVVSGDIAALIVADATPGSSMPAMQSTLQTAINSLRIAPQ